MCVDRWGGGGVKIQIDTVARNKRNTERQTDTDRQIETQRTTDPDRQIERERERDTQRCIHRERE